ncbi:hypothetical protein EF914_37150 [Streptomyces sp. WAC05458]|nr:tyrosine-type recombinase/integrase [Streptomyces sp. KAI 90]RSS10766.1 hypothetical protein EF914_37150 [Streptomyces sp. WAC05458]RSS87590.1 hypothetical protein EF919_33555 [Streptomyces sp. WAC02707]
MLAARQLGDVHGHLVLRGVGPIDLLGAGLGDVLVGDRPGVGGGLGRVDPANLTRRFRSFLDQAGLRCIRFHDLRHSTATLLLEQGINLVVIEEWLGHAHIGVTAGVYAHVRLRLQRQAIDTLGNALGPTDDDPNYPLAVAVVR